MILWNLRDGGELNTWYETRAAAEAAVTDYLFDREIELARYELPDLPPKKLAVLCLGGEGFASGISTVRTFRPTLCPHDRPVGHCDACDVAGDFAADAAREDRIFGRTR